MDEKFILDATAGYRMMWFNKHHPNALYIDQRPECEPDTITDFTNLKEFADNSFKLIVFDPPHLVNNGNGLAPNIANARRFGALNCETWQKDLKQAFKEFFRVLQNYGILVFKWNNARIPSSEIIKLSPVPPLFYQISSNRKKKGAKSGSDEIRTLWFCFMKIPEETNHD